MQSLSMRVSRKIRKDFQIQIRVVSIGFVLVIVVMMMMKRISRGLKIKTNGDSIGDSLIK